MSTAELTIEPDQTQKAIRDLQIANAELEKQVQELRDKIERDEFWKENRAKQFRERLAAQKRQTDRYNEEGRKLTKIIMLLNEVQDDIEAGIEITRPREVERLGDGKWRYQTSITITENPDFLKALLVRNNLCESIPADSICDVSAVGERIDIEFTAEHSTKG